MPRASTKAKKKPAAAGPAATATKAASEEMLHGSRSDYVYQYLRKQIQTGALKPGDRVMEVEVAEALQVSRTPVRDALRRLEADGMAVIEPRIGLQIASLSRQATLELYLMRELLEGTAARLCATNANESEQLDLEQLVLRERSLQGDYPALAKHNRSFHEAIYQGAHNRFLEKSLRAVNDSVWLLGPSQMLTPERAEQALQQHEEIVRAILSRDGALAEQLVRAHIDAAKRRRLAAMFERQGL
jgi:DNA-binding GntR family transcriptional regulator